MIGAGRRVCPVTWFTIYCVCRAEPYTNPVVSRYSGSCTLGASVGSVSLCQEFPQVPLLCAVTLPPLSPPSGRKVVCIRLALARAFPRVAPGRFLAGQIPWLAQCDIAGFRVADVDQPGICTL